MAFIQIIDFRTSRIDEGKALVADYLAKTEGRRTSGRGLICQDRDDPTHFLNIVFFESYELAMQNSEMPETNELAEKMMALTDGAPSFLNLDVVDDRS